MKLFCLGYNRNRLQQLCGKGSVEAQEQESTNASQMVAWSMCVDSRKCCSRVAATNHYFAGT
jgi:hypothetical protein